MSGSTVVSFDYINVSITTSANQTCPIERRFQKSITIQDFKDKLELLTGGNSQSMKVEIYDKNDKLICQLNNPNRLLGSYPIDDGMRIHVIDNFVKEEDLSQVEKFELSEEEYAKRTDTVKSFLERNKLGKYNEEEAKRKEQMKKQQEEADRIAASSFKVGDRCEVQVPNQPRRRATIMYVGKTHFRDGLWVGVKYDEPFGKNDGSVDGKRYFDCCPKYGGFVKPSYVNVGDFPEEDIDLDEEI